MAAEKNLQSAFDFLSTTSGANNGKLPLENIRKWFKQYLVSFGQEMDITDTHVHIPFEISARGKCAEVTFADLKDCLVNIAKEKKIDPDYIMEKVACAALPKIEQEASSSVPNIEQKTAIAALPKMDQEASSSVPDIEQKIASAVLPKMEQKVSSSVPNIEHKIASAALPKMEQEPNSLIPNTEQIIANAELP